jgi:transposase
VVNPKADSHSTRVLKRLRQRNSALQAVEKLMAMIRQTKATKLVDWTANARAVGDPDLANLAESLLSGAAGVQAALTEAWSNGQVEGQVNRLKVIKRQKYGQAGMDLLRPRVRHKG